MFFTGCSRGAYPPLRRGSRRCFAAARGGVMGRPPCKYPLSVCSLSAPAGKRARAEI